MRKFSIIIIIITVFTYTEPYKIAMLVGIDDYKYLENKKLYGCENDVDLASKTLAEYFEFSQKDLIVLKGVNATQKKIMNSFVFVLEKIKKFREEQAKSEIQFFLLWSGHGYQVKNLNPTEDIEVDGKDETLLAYDSQKNSAKTQIIDDQIDEFLTSLSKQNVYSTIIFDTCHSGSATKTLTKIRGLPPTEGLPSQKIAKSEFHPAIPRTIFISACLSYEKAPEFFDSSSQKHYGLLTYQLCRSLLQHIKHHKTITYKSLFDNLIAFYAEIIGAPTPTIEGDISREFLRNRKFSLNKNTMQVISTPFHEKSKADDYIHLSAGSILGITQGSIVGLMDSSGNITENGQVVGKHILCKISEVQIFYSTAKILTDKERRPYIDYVNNFAQDNAKMRDVTPGWQAVELFKNHNNEPLNLYLQQEFLKIVGKKKILRTGKINLCSRINQLLFSMEKQNIIAIVDVPEKAHVILRQGKAKASFYPKNDANFLRERFIQNASPESYEPIDGFSVISAKNTTVSDLKTVEKTLEQIKKIHNLLKTPSHQNNFTSLPKVYTIQQGKKVFLHDSIVKLKHGEKLYIELNNTEDFPIYASVVYISSDYSISVAGPLSPAYHTPSQQKSNFYYKDQRKIYVLENIEITTDKTQGQEWLLVFLSKNYVDLRELQTQGLLPKSNKKGELFSLQRLIAEFSSSTPRGQLSGTVEELWSIYKFSFRSVR